MGREGILGIAAIVTVGVALPAAAQESPGYRAIAVGDLGAAEQTLVAERRIFPGRPELMLNLAAVYAKTGREAQARVLYDAVIASDPVDLELSNGAVLASHAVARAGLSKLAGARVATR